MFKTLILKMCWCTLVHYPGNIFSTLYHHLSLISTTVLRKCKCKCTKCCLTVTPALNKNGNFLFSLVRLKCSGVKQRKGTGGGEGVAVHRRVPNKVAGETSRLARVCVLCFSAVKVSSKRRKVDIRRPHRPRTFSHASSSAPLKMRRSSQSNSPRSSSVAFLSLMPKAEKIVYYCYANSSCLFVCLLPLSCFHGRRAAPPCLLWCACRECPSVCAQEVQ